jgi:hypothetical protein
VDRESAAARSVISTQASLHFYHEEDSTYPLGNGPHLKLLSRLFGTLPGPQGSPEFYLGLLSWSRKGFPPLQLKLSEIDPALTPREIYLRKLQQLTQPGDADSFNKKPNLTIQKETALVTKKDFAKQNKALMEKDFSKVQTDMLKNKAVNSGH